MPTLRTTNEDPIQIYDGLEFVSKQDVSPGQTHLPAYTVEGTENYVIGVEKNTPLALELRDVNGNKIDESARVTLQKADPQGNPLGNAIVFDANMGQFNYEKMRSDPEFFKTTTKSLLIDEREFLHIYVDLPSGANAMDAANSRITIGDNVTQTGKPVFVRDKETLSSNQKKAVKQASTGGN